MPPTPSKSEEEKREPCMAQYKQLNGEAGSWGLKHGSSEIVRTGTSEIVSKSSLGIPLAKA